MPYKMSKTKSGEYKVSGPSGIHSRNTTEAKAESQMRLLRGIEHGWKPTGKSTSGNALRNAVMGSSMAVVNVARSKKKGK